MKRMLCTYDGEGFKFTRKTTSRSNYGNKMLFKWFVGVPADSHCSLIRATLSYHIFTTLCVHLARNLVVDCIQIHSWHYNNFISFWWDNIQSVNQQEHNNTNDKPSTTTNMMSYKDISMSGHFLMQIGWWLVTNAVKAMTMITHTSTDEIKEFKSFSDHISLALAALRFQMHLFNIVITLLQATL